MVRVVLLYAIHAITRFPRGQDGVSSGRVVTCAKASAGKREGTAGPKSGKASLQWACSAAAVLFLRTHPAGQKSLARLEQKQGQGQALPVLAHKLARAVSSRLQREVGFARTLVLQRAGRGAGEPAAALGHEGRAWHPCSALMPPVRRRTPMRPEALGPAPARVIGRLLALLARGRKFLMVPVGCPSPAPGAHWRLEMGRLACA